MPIAPDATDDTAKGLIALHVDRLIDADHAALMRLCGPDVDLTESTVAAYSYEYRRYLGFLTANRDAVLALPPAARFGAPHLTAYADLLLAEKGKAVTLAVLKQLSQCLRLAVPAAPRDALKALIATIHDVSAAPNSKVGDRLKAIKSLPTADRALLTQLERSEPPSATTRITRANAIGDYKRFLGVLALQCPEVLALAPEQRITHASVEAYARALEARGGAKATAMRLRAFKLAIKLVLPGVDLAPIMDATRHYRRLANGGSSPRDMRASSSAKRELCSPPEIQTLDALEQDDILNDRGAARKATARGFRYCYLEFIACAARHEPALLERPLARRDLPAMLRCYIAEKQPLWARSTMTTALTSILRVLSRMLPAGDLSPLRDEIRKFHYTPNTDFWGTTVDVAELLALGLRICDEARARLRELRDVKHPYRSLRSLAERYRNGLMILTLGLSALRVTNFSELGEGTTFVDEHGRHRIKLAGADVKNRSDIRLTLAQSSRVYFEDYLGWIRALIVRADGCKALWPSDSGDALSVSQIQRIITGVVEDDIGTHVTCHDFRRSAASSASSDAANPSDAPEIAIGDRNRRVVDRHYLNPTSQRLGALDALAAIADDCGWQG